MSPGGRAWLMRAAVILSRCLPGLPAGLRHWLLRLDTQLADVTPVTARQRLEPWGETRLNTYLHHALPLAELIVGHACIRCSPTARRYTCWSATLSTPTATRSAVVVFTLLDADVITSPVRALAANATCERFIGSVHRELLDWILIVNAAPARRVLGEHEVRVNTCRPRRSLNHAAPLRALPSGACIPICCGDQTRSARQLDPRIGAGRVAAARFRVPTGSLTRTTTPQDFQMVTCRQRWVTTPFLG